MSAISISITARPRSLPLMAGPRSLALLPPNFGFAKRKLPSVKKVKAEPYEVYMRYLDDFKRFQPPRFQPPEKEDPIEIIGPDKNGHVWIIDYPRLPSGEKIKRKTDMRLCPRFMAMEKLPVITPELWHDILAGKVFLRDYFTGLVNEEYARLDIPPGPSPEQLIAFEFCESL